MREWLRHRTGNPIYYRTGIPNKQSARLRESSDREELADWSGGNSRIGGISHWLWWRGCAAKRILHCRLNRRQVLIPIVFFLRQRSNDDDDQWSYVYSICFRSSEFKRSSRSTMVISYDSLYVVELNSDLRFWIQMLNDTLMWNRSLPSGNMLTSVKTEINILIILTIIVASHWLTIFCVYFRQYMNCLRSLIVDHIADKGWEGYIV